MQSLLKDERRVADNSNGTAVTRPPVAFMAPSSLQSLLTRRGPVSDTEEEDASRPRPAARSSSSSLSSLLQDEPRRGLARGGSSSPAYELEWWKEKPERPAGYVRHFQPIHTSYVKKFEAPRDYGNINADPDFTLDRTGATAFYEKPEEISGADEDAVTAITAQEKNEEEDVEEDKEDKK